MCLGSLVQARMRRLVFGALDPKWGAVESIMEFPFKEMNHLVLVKGGILSEECGKIIKEFFLGRR
jgi:tRNA(adenine34) deaminase